MRRRVRLLGACLAVLAVVVPLAGCHEQEQANEVDSARVREIRAQPMFAGAHVRAATTRTSADVEFRRAQVTAELTGSDPRRTAADGLRRMRRHGWTVSYVSCTSAHQVQAQAWREFTAAGDTFTGYADLSTSGPVQVTVLVPFHSEPGRPLPVPEAAVDPAHTCLAGAEASGVSGTPMDLQSLR